MLLSPRKNGLTSLFKEVRVFKEVGEVFWAFRISWGPKKSFNSKESLEAFPRIF